MTLVLAAGAAGLAGPAAAQAVSQRLAPIDLTGTWVSVVTEDWHLRMVTPKHGEYEGVPLNDEAKRIADTWMPPHDGRDACEAYGAPAIMRIPGRVRMSWQAGGTELQVQTDAGEQTRVLHFGGAPPRGPAGWQGYSVASWEYARGFDPVVPQTAGARQSQAEQARAAGGTLKVVTTNLRPGLLRKNGVPFSEQTTVTEYFEIEPDPRGTPWFVVTTVVSDPKYLLKEYITSSNFKKEPDGSKWHPTPCSFD